ncbi:MULTISPECIES: hypothetical protein [unclassified Microcoleus]|uniref:hypothetical protein n=1 Tax=unclassified Microcoleus TaxID=2642155 RepID=UPI002FD381FA
MYKPGFNRQLSANSPPTPRRLPPTPANSPPTPANSPPTPADSRQLPVLLPGNKHRKTGLAKL